MGFRSWCFEGKLRSTLNYDEWEKISNCEIWDIHEKMNGVFPPLCCHNRIVFYGSRWICTICCRTLSLEELTGCTDGCTIPNKLRKSCR